MIIYIIQFFKFYFEINSRGGLNHKIISLVIDLFSYLTYYTTSFTKKVVLLLKSMVTLIIKFANVKILHLSVIPVCYVANEILLYHYFPLLKYLLFFIMKDIVVFRSIYLVFRTKHNFYLLNILNFLLYKAK